MSGVGNRLATEPDYDLDYKSMFERATRACERWARICERQRVLIEGQRKENAELCRHLSPPVDDSSTTWLDRRREEEGLAVKHD